jgi:hypothetical protein
MQTLQLLFASEELTKNHSLREIAISHADKTLENHVRSDGKILELYHDLSCTQSSSLYSGSTFHIVEYNSTTGVVIRKRQSFGYSDNRQA